MGKRHTKSQNSMGVGKTQIQTLGKRKRKILEDFDNNIPSSTKRHCHITGNDEVNRLCLDFF